MKKFPSIVVITFFCFTAALLLLHLLGCESDDDRFKPEPVDPGELVVERPAWEESSFPAQLGNRQIRGKLLWHNASSVVVPEEYQAVGRNKWPMRITFLPNVPAPEIGEIGYVTDSSNKRWNSLIMPLSGQINWPGIQYLYVRGRSNNIVLHIDLGRINCDRNGNGSADSEDKDYNEVVSEWEDIGLDGLPDVQEPGYDPLTNPDPSGDNWWYSGYPTENPPVPASVLSDTAFQRRINDINDPMHYYWINGMEVNRSDPANQGYPDEEKMGTSLNEIDAYFSYHINFASDSFLISESNAGGWKAYRIQFKMPVAIDTTIISDLDIPPMWDPEHMQHIRIWIESEALGGSAADTLILTRMNFD